MFHLISLLTIIFYVYWKKPLALYGLTQISCWDVAFYYQYAKYYYPFNNPQTFSLLSSVTLHNTSLLGKKIKLATTSHYCLSCLPSLTPRLCLYTTQDRDPPNGTRSLEQVGKGHLQVPKLRGCKQQHKPKRCELQAPQLADVLM